LINMFAGGTVVPVSIDADVRCRESGAVSGPVVRFVGTRGWPKRFVHRDMAG
jgi:hypothetical protein